VTPTLENVFNVSVPNRSYIRFLSDVQEEQENNDLEEEEVSEEEDGEEYNPEHDA
jgi:hypothetical protein